MRRIIGALCLVLMASQAPAAAGHGELPLGVPGLAERRVTQELASGVTYTRIDRGHVSGRDFWTIDVAVTLRRAEARAIAANLRGAGYDADVVALDDAPDDPRRGPSGYVVRSGEFASRAEADERLGDLLDRGYDMAQTVYSADVGEPTTGPFVVHVLAVDPERNAGTVAPELATQVVPGREPLTDMVRRTDALAGVNGGYFVIGEADGTPGDLAGISVLEGALVSEAVNGRTSLLVRPSGRGDIAALSTTIRATVAHRRFVVDGYNREPGEIRSCGGVGGDEPTQRPRHDFTCTDAAELIVFTPAFGSFTEPGAGTEVAVDASGRIVEVRMRRGGAIPADGFVLSATGATADALQSAARVGRRARVRAVVTGTRHGPALGGRIGVVNGGPRLVERGHDRITAFAEGFVWPDDPAFFYRFGLSRHPRTMAGITRDGTLLLVAIDGRQAGYSAGATFDEEAGVMRALGAVEAVNLDGGGSTTMVVDGELVNRPSDATGERPIGDALLLHD